MRGDGPGEPATVSQAVFGVYMGSSFAPNHKGTPMVAGVRTADKAVTTSAV